jgi:AbrB family looped-hinge helix DNA binding protein
MTHATLSEKFQLSIPKAIRERLRLRAGQQFVFVTKGDTITLVPRRTADEVRGMMKGAGTDELRDRKERV